MKKFVFIWEHTDGCTYSCKTITPFECENLDEFILQSVEKINNSDYGGEILGQYIDKYDIDNLFSSFFDLDKWFKLNKLTLNKK
jgi:hypothetical protein